MVDDRWISSQDGKFSWLGSPHQPASHRQPNIHPLHRRVDAGAGSRQLHSVKWPTPSVGRGGQFRLHQIYLVGRQVYYWRVRRYKRNQFFMDIRLSHLHCGVNLLHNFQQLRWDYDFSRLPRWNITSSDISQYRRPNQTRTLRPIRPIRRQIILRQLRWAHLDHIQPIQRYNLHHLQRSDSKILQQEPLRLHILPILDLFHQRLWDPLLPQC